jgi:hypothetical protein
LESFFWLSKCLLKLLRWLFSLLEHISFEPYRNCYILFLGDIKQETRWTPNYLNRLQKCSCGYRNENRQVENYLFNKLYEHSSNDSNNNSNSYYHIFHKKWNKLEKSFENNNFQNNRWIIIFPYIETNLFWREVNFSRVDTKTNGRSIDKGTREFIIKSKLS